jgi:5'-nucleotidase
MGTLDAAACERMRILVTNDDGVFSPGLSALAEAASKFGDVRIVAPDIEQSSMAHAITSSLPLSHRPVCVKDFEAFRVNGTPADCVGLGLFVWSSVDLVLSGINLGLNVGNAMWHSGTLAAAKQAALLGVRGIALSAPDTAEGSGYDALRPRVEAVLARLLETPELRLVNVNFPLAPRGIRFTRQSVRRYDARIERARDPQGRAIYWFVPRPLDAAEPGTDRWAVENNLVSITPLRLDLTDHDALRGLEEAVNHDKPASSRPDWDSEDLAPSTGTQPGNS